ncbi:alpha/beta hydrolase [Maribacter sp. 2307UL18-2]|uniref:alpha/beta hydrolase n=1 Tax=Maribacter sp. 2307UL18-2 TaxID=3386274 RepID=UPI0039BC8F26
MNSIVNYALCLFTCLSITCASSQATDRGQIKQFLDVDYLEPAIRTDTLRMLNLFIPQNQEQPPLFIWIGGGAWSYGNKDEETDFALKLAEKGIAVASLGHRLSPAIWRDPKLNSGVQHPEHAKDVTSAIAWLCENSKDYGFDSENIFIGGYSSGAHLAALVSLDAKYLESKGLSPKLIKGIIPISGTYDIVDYRNVFLNGDRPELAVQHVEAVFGADYENWMDGSPVNYLQNLSSPIFLICDNSLYNYTKLFEDRIRKTEFRKVTVLYAYDLSHGELWRNLSHSERSIYRDAIIGFIQGLSDSTKSD